MGEQNRRRGTCDTRRKSLLTGHDLLRKFKGPVLQTLFCIGSSSKAFTASAIGILIDDFASGRNTTPLPPGLNSFDWNTKVKDILPGQWGLKDEWASEKANIRDILGHVSGLAR
jgi:CubicO group peptidase (beta-lactamase class C family)